MVVDVRAQTNETMKEILEKIARASEYGAKSVGATAAIESTKRVPAAEYDPGLHSEKMRFDPEALIIGTKILCALLARKVL